jgi:hypothetical protein
MPASIVTAHPEIDWRGWVGLRNLIREIREQVHVAPRTRVAARHRAIDIELLDAELRCGRQSACPP